MVAKYLLEKGAEKNLQDVDGETALHYACAKSDGHRVRMVRLLLKHTCQTDIEDNKGQKPIDLLPEDSQVRVELLKKEKPSPESTKKKRSEEEEYEENKRQCTVLIDLTDEVVEKEDENIIDLSGMFPEVRLSSEGAIDWDTIYDLEKESFF